jgi:uncharacterized integral membrane protein (TIGR00697 family)
MMLSFLPSYQTEIISIVQLLVSWVFLFIFAFRYEKAGVYVYIVVAVILSNVQVLKLGHFFWSDQPVALGTVVFASTFLATDILTEFYSAESARKAVTLGFLGFAFFSSLMLLQVWIPEISPTVLVENNLVDGHKAMVALFTPMPSLYIASIISYFISERIDISLYVLFKHLTREKALWFRSIAAATISAFIDTAIFSILAWKIFAIQPVNWSVLFYTYILGSFWPRILVSITGVPVLYMLRYWLRRS